MKYLLSFALLATAPQLHAQSSADTSLWAMIQQGGWAMIPLSACCLALIYLVILCYRETKVSRFVDLPLSQSLAQRMAAEDLEAAETDAARSPTTLGRSFAAALPKLDPNRTSETLPSLEAEVSASLSSEQSVVARWIHYLSVLANVSPMIGLLGTVSGMIGGFQTMSAGGMGRPELFAGDIGEALITTATGLCIGIPAMVAHSFFNNRLSAAIEQTTRQANSILDHLPASEPSYAPATHLEPRT